MPRLKEYQSKRNLTETPEPKAKIAHSHEKQLVFVVHKHRATRLHYDLRLELNGVLLSWAIPKGPSLNTADKRLAIMVEDHPFDYRTFEGTIPKGNYGAGEVIIWDEGNYAAANATNRKESEKLIAAGLKKGHLDLVFNGQKMKGSYTLIHTHGMGEKNTWLLMKKKDEFSSQTDITKLDRSVTTNRTIEDIAHETDPMTNKSKGKKSKILHDVIPMLAYLHEEPFNSKEWIFEIKWDGYRAIAQIEKHRVELYSRNGLSFNSHFPELVDDLQKIPVQSVVLDGEVVLLDKEGKSQFQLMQNYQRAQKGDLHYYVFDILYLDGYSLTHLPLIQRKEILKSLLTKANSSLVNYSDHVEEKGIAFFKAAAKQQLEGIMAKKKDSVYHIGRRSHDWLKIKTHMEQEVVIGGFTEPKGSRQYFGALLVGVYEGKKLIYAGKVGGGYTDRLLSDVHGQLVSLIQKESPFEDAPKMSGVTWIKPKLVAEVSFGEWTDEGLMRQPIFKGLRIDKSPKEVKREKAS